MVHTWLSLRNDKLTCPCLSARFMPRIFRGEDHAYFYGDYDLDIYIGTKHDYPSLDAVVAAVVRQGGGWIRNIKHKERTEMLYIANIINEFGHLPDKRKLFPHKESAFDVRLPTDIYRHDGNFKMYACETPRFYYVFCFATS